MEQNPENYDFGLKDANVKIMNRNTDNFIKSTNAAINLPVQVIWRLI